MEELEKISEIVLNNYIFILLVNSSSLDVNTKESIIKNKYNQDNEFVNLSKDEFFKLFNKVDLKDDEKDLIVTNALINSLSDEEVIRK